MNLLGGICLIRDNSLELSLDGNTTTQELANFSYFRSLGHPSELLKQVARESVIILLERVLS
jgi:hypothetical protein